MLLATPETKIGQEISSGPFVMTREMIAQFSDPQTIHTDDEVAKRMGLPSILAEGFQVYGIVSEMLASFFREGWFMGGRLSISFLSPVWLNDTVTSGGIVKEKIVENGKTRLNLRVWLENQWRAKVVMGVASGLVP